MAYRIEWDQRGVVVTMTGETDIFEINEVNGLIQGHEGFDSMDYQVIDLVDVEFTAVTARQLDQPAATDKAASRMKADVKVALVAQSDANLEHARIYSEASKSMGSPWEFRTFTELQPALEWARG